MSETTSSTARSDYEDSLQETAYAPTRYPLGDPGEQVTYTDVLGDDGAAIGAVYISASGGLSTLFYANSGDTMTSLIQQLTQLYAQGLTASQAYEQLTSVDGVSYGEESVDTLSNLFNPAAATIAAAQPDTTSSDAQFDLPNGSVGQMPADAHLYVTEEDDGTVIDLVYSDDQDVYLRQPDSSWSPVTGDGTDSDPIDGRVIVDVDPSYVRAYDAARSNDDTITDDDIAQYRVNAA